MSATLRGLLLACFVLVIAPGIVRAQEREPVARDSAAVDDSVAALPDSALVVPPAARRPPPVIPTVIPSLEGLPSPRGAMLRSFLVPGWGQSAYGHYVRGGVYFMGNAGNLYMVLKTFARLGEARDREARWVEATRDSLLAAGTPADSIDFYVDEDADVRSIRGLVSAREEQREDWLALGIFWVLVSGIDAYVTGQLADFPASIGAVIDDRRIGFVVSLPAR